MLYLTLLRLFLWLAEEVVDVVASALDLVQPQFLLDVSRYTLREGLHKKTCKFVTIGASSLFVENATH